jgi:hypothetical protein
MQGSVRIPCAVADGHGSDTIRRSRIDRVGKVGRVDIRPPRDQLVEGRNHDVSPCSWVVANPADAAFEEVAPANHAKDNIEVSMFVWRYQIMNLCFYEDFFCFLLVLPPRHAKRLLL